MPLPLDEPAEGLSPYLWESFKLNPERLLGTRWLWRPSDLESLIEVVHIERDAVLWVSDYAPWLERHWTSISVLLSRFGAFRYLGTREALAWIRPEGWVRVKHGGYFAQIVGIESARVRGVRIATSEPNPNPVLPPQSDGWMPLDAFLENFEATTFEEASAHFRSLRETGDGDTGPEGDSSGDGYNSGDPTIETPEEIVEVPGRFERLSQPELDS